VGGDSGGACGLVPRQLKVAGGGGRPPQVDKVFCLLHLVVDVGGRDLPVWRVSDEGSVVLREVVDAYKHLKFVGSAVD
jgi:hypothetical protein